MAECLEALLSLDDIYRSLAGFPQDRLHELLSRLQQGPPTDNRKLLEAIILKSLGQPKSALELLKSMPHIKAAQYVANKVQNESLPCRGDQVSPSPQDPEVLQTVEQIYRLLQKENIWCDPDQPRTLMSGLGFSPSSRSPRVKSHCIPITGAKRSPCTASGSLLASNSVDSLNSNLAISQSPTALFITGRDHRGHQPRSPSKLINDAPNSHVQQRGGGGGNVAGDIDVNRGMLVTHPVKDTEKQTQGDTGSSPQVFKEPTNEHYPYPVECTDMPGTRPPVSVIESVSAHCPEKTSALSFINDTKPVTSHPSTLPVECASTLKERSRNLSAPSTPSLPIADTSPQEQTEVKKPPTSYVSPPSTELESTEDGFFSFVILHVPEDDEIASSVQGKLESLGVKNGTTFCEGFTRPGSCRLTCLEGAINSSAFTILLLTKQWTSRWADFQTNAVLMNAIESKHKYNTVIPFLPHTDRLQKNNIPLCLKTLNPLDENSLKFSTVVKNTFKPCQIEKQKNIWRREEQIRVIKEKTEYLKVETEQLQQVQDANKDLIKEQHKYFRSQSGSFMWPNLPGVVPGSFPPFPQGEPPFQQMQWLPGTIPPPDAGFPFYPGWPGALYNMSPQLNPHFLYGSVPQVSQTLPSGSQGTQYASGVQHPVIQIQHASHVQIGDRNQMTIESTDGEEKKTKEEEPEEEEAESLTLP
ncbi:TIR domain-containing adapter molecule 1-like [Lissotriton helveticus]